MSYSKKYKERTIEYRISGYTLNETHEVFKVARSQYKNGKGSIKKQETWKRKNLEPIPKLAMNPNKFTPNNNSAGKSE